MLGSTLDLIVQAASNSFLVFCVCNLIIAMIVFGSKPSPNLVQDSELAVLINTRHSHGRSKALAEIDANGVSCCLNRPSEENNHGEQSDGDDEEDDLDGSEDVEEQNDALRRRAEEFIAKVNGQWRAEKLRTCLA